MRRVHPLWRGFWLALTMAAALTLLPASALDETGALRLDRRALAFALAMAAGAFLAALPGRLKRWKRGPRAPRPELWRCLRAFLSGAVMALACGMAGTGRILPALMEGSTGAYAFVAVAWLTGCITARLVGRRAAA